PERDPATWRQAVGDLGGGEVRVVGAPVQPSDRACRQSEHSWTQGTASLPGDGGELTNDGIRMHTAREVLVPRERRGVERQHELRALGQREVERYPEPGLVPRSLRECRPVSRGEQGKPEAHDE